MVLTTVRLQAIVAAAVLGVGLAGAGCGGPATPDPCAGRPYKWSVVHEEIAAAARLNFDSSRADALGRIADRPTLTPDEQAHLVHAAVESLPFESSREQVLRRLIENPSFAPPAKACILRHLDRFAFDSTRAGLLRAMEGRGDRFPEPPIPAPPARPDTRPADQP